MQLTLTIHFRFPEHYGATILVKKVAINRKPLPLPLVYNLNKYTIHSIT